MATFFLSVAGIRLSGPSACQVPVYSNCPPALTCLIGLKILPLPVSAVLADGI